MNWYKTSQSDTFQDWFKEETERMKKIHVVSKDEPSVESTILKLYRGFDADLHKLQKSNDNYILSPEKSEQGMIWFSQNINVAQGRGKYLLIYPLRCKKHIQQIHYSDGRIYRAIPEEIQEKTMPTENCKFFGGIELPDGWFFSYKTEKHIVCSIPVLIKPEMIKLDEYYEQ